MTDPEPAVQLDGYPLPGQLFEAWARPSADSLLLLRSAAEGLTLVVIATTKGDTLQGRAETSSDRIRPDMPAALAVGIRYDCSPRGLQRARTALVAALPTDSAARSRGRP